VRHDGRARGSGARAASRVRVGGFPPGPPVAFPPRRTGAPEWECDLHPCYRRAKMILALKLGVIAIYVAALAGAAGLLPAGIGAAAQALALGILFLHVLELLFAFQHVRRYRGPLAMSVLLTILFGVLHWKPLAAARPAQ